MMPAASLLPSATAKEEATHSHPQHRRPSARPEAKHGTTERPTRPSAAQRPNGCQGPPAWESSGHRQAAGVAAMAAHATFIAYRILLIARFGRSRYFFADNLL
jgi:hypothetical protein